jgi:hypothetical protein
MIVIKEWVISEEESKDSYWCRKQRLICVDQHLRFEFLSEWSTTGDDWQPVMSRDAEMAVQDYGGITVGGTLIVPRHPCYFDIRDTYQRAKLILELGGVVWSEAPKEVSIEHQSRFLRLLLDD